MPKIDFKHFKAYTSIAQKEKTEIDISFQVADSLYKNSNGIVAHDLAHRIYKSDGPMELTKEETDAIMAFVKEQFTPLFIDSFEANIE